MARYCDSPQHNTTLKKLKFVRVYLLLFHVLVTEPIGFTFGVEFEYIQD